MKKVFTTGEIAKICSVAPRTVSKWLDCGHLHGYRLPGSQDRRIPREHLIRFLKEHGMPLAGLEDETTSKILLVGLDSVLVQALRGLFESDGFEIKTTDSSFGTGVVVESKHPHCVVIDTTGVSEGLQIAKGLKLEYQNTIVIGLGSVEGLVMGGEEWLGTYFDAFFRKPLDIALLAERIRKLTADKQLVA